MMRIREQFSLTLFSEKKISSRLFEEDILLRPEEKFAIDNNLDVESAAHTFGASKNRRWTNGIVPYTIAESLSMMLFFEKIVNMLRLSAQVFKQR